MAHDANADSAAGFAIDSLDPDERARIAAHVDSCAECADAVRSYAPVVEALAWSAPDRALPASARAALMARVHASVVPAVSSRKFDVTTWLPLAASFVALLGVGSYAMVLRDRVADLERRLFEAERVALRDASNARREGARLESAVAVLSAGDMVRIDLAGQAISPAAHARALWSRERGMVFTAGQLPPLPPGKVYQVWVVTAQAAVSAGLLALDTNGAAVGVYQTPADIPPPVAVAVTIEPEGGVPAPTGEKYLVGMI